jgi:NAD(P)-dependent dehydrogenase (short-subunit alcohol dehydrogenase family)
VSFLNQFRLDGKTIIVTGASVGLGAEFARSCADVGASVVLGARRKDALARVVGDIEARGGIAAAFVADVRHPGECQALAQFAVQTFGSVHGLVNNAGVASVTPAVKEAPEQFREVLDINLVGSFQMAQAAASRMTDGGSIVNVSSILGSMSMGIPHAAYSASKAGLDGLTRDLAAEWTRRRSIRVNAILPGFVESDMTAGFSERTRKWIEDRLPLGRMGRPDEMSAAVVFLLSNASSYVTGSCLVIDGGALIV